MSVSVSIFQFWSKSYISVAKMAVQSLCVWKVWKNVCTLPVFLLKPSKGKMTQWAQSLRKSHRLSNRYTIPLMSSNVLFCLFHIQMISEDFRLHCYTSTIKGGILMIILTIRGCWWKRAKCLFNEGTVKRCIHFSCYTRNNIGTMHLCAATTFIETWVKQAHILPLVDCCSYCTPASIKCWNWWVNLSIILKYKLMSATLES